MYPATASWLLFGSLTLLKLVSSHLFVAYGLFQTYLQTSLEYPKNSKQVLMITLNNDYMISHQQSIRWISFLLLSPTYDDSFLMMLSALDFTSLLLQMDLWILFSIYLFIFRCYNEGKGCLYFVSHLVSLSLEIYYALLKLCWKLNYSHITWIFAMKIWYSLGCCSWGRGVSGSPTIEQVNCLRV